MKTKIILSLVAAGAFALAGCASNPTPGQVGTAAGAVVGGVVGSGLGMGTAGTVGGAAAGALIGNELGKRR